MGAKIVAFDKEECETVKIPNGVILRQAKIFKLVLEMDIIINVPVMKTHNETLVTLGIKNFHGILHDSYKLQYHRNDTSQKLVDLYKVVPSHLPVIETMKAMEGFGPAMGKCACIRNHGHISYGDRYH